MKVIKQDDVIDVIYDSWYGLSLDKADKVVYDYTHGKLIPVEWIKQWFNKQYYIYEKEMYLKDMLEDWEAENEIYYDTKAMDTEIHG